MTPSSQLKAGTEPRKPRRNDAFTQAGAQPLCSVLLETGPLNYWLFMGPRQPPPAGSSWCRVIALLTVNATFHSSGEQLGCSTHPNIHLPTCDLRVFRAGLVNVGEVPELAPMWNGQLWG